MVRRTCSKNKGSRSGKRSSKDGMTSLPESIKRRRGDRKICRVSQDRRKQCKKNLGEWAEDNERLRNGVEDTQARDGRQSPKKKTLWPKRTWMRTSGACKLEMKGDVVVHRSPMGPTLQHSLHTSGADLVRQQRVLLQNRVREDVWSAVSAGASHSIRCPGGRRRK